MTDWSAFFELHRDLPREGPGEPADVAWAAELAGLPPGARICDAACGPGADIGTLLKAAPAARVDAVEKRAAFVEQARAHWGDDPRVTVRQGDMGDLTGPYHMIWCAGALYFLGVTEGLTKWRSALAHGGKVAFSEPCWFTDTPSDGAQKHWAEYPPMTDEAGITRWVTDAGYEVLGTRRVSDAAWEAYYTPMEQRIAMLRPNAGPELLPMLDEGQAEVDGWRRHRHEAGYMLFLVRPA